MKPNLADCPHWLAHDDSYRALWAELVPLLQANGTLTPATRELLGEFVLNAVSIREIQASDLAKEVVTMNTRGQPRLNPALKALARMTNANSQLARKLGLFPKPRRPGKLDSMADLS